MNMKPSSTFSLPGEYDLIVIGGGSAGSAAAVAASRRGLRTLLVEESNSLGGTSTAGGVSEWFASLEGLGEVFDDVKNGLEAFSARFGQFFNSEYLKIVWQLLAQDAGVDLLFHSSLAGADTVQSGEKHRVEQVSILSASRQAQTSAKFYIDSSGEGDLAFLAGAETMQGDPQTGRTLHLSLTFTLVDTGQPVRSYLPPGLEPITSSEDLPGLRANHRLPDGRIYCNMTKLMGYDPTDPVSLSRAEGEARIQLLRVLHYLQTTRYPTCTLLGSGARIGIREGRRVVGDVVIEEGDILGERERIFADRVCIATSQIDFHSLTTAGDGGRREAVLPYPIPFRALTVRGFTNLLTAGKCISGDQVAHSSYRMTPTCVAMGEAAGTAAALAIKNGASDIRAASIQELQSELTAHGMELDPARHRPYPH